ncbi:dihydrolipoyl dehydrogenase family protein [Microlunatus elymi]|nr:FAD-dependent oxidoreductase [Microlunatus elymi]
MTSVHQDLTQPQGQNPRNAQRVQDAEQQCELLVIGAGSAGIAAAAAGQRAGAKVTVIERERPGGASLWTGTVPTKALIAAARAAHLMRTADRFAITPVEPQLNFGELMRGIQDRVSAAAPTEPSGALQRLGVDVVAGAARFTGPETIMVGDVSYRFSRAVIASGTAPAMPPIPGLVECNPLTVTSFWELRFLPEQVTLIGGGPTGCEFAQALARLGSKVRIIELADRLLPREEPEASEMIAERLRSEGVEVLTGTAVRRAISYAHHQQLIIAGPDGAEPVTIESGRIMVTAGRRPVTVGLDLPRAGVFLNEQGYIAVDDRLRTENRKVYAAGDAVGDRPLASLAELDGEIAATNAVSGRSRIARHELGPQVVFTDPEIGRIGHTEMSARVGLGDWLRVRKSSGRIDRAIAENEPSGLTKIISNGHGRMVGATVISPRAGEVITELATVLQRGGRIADLASVPHAYPTWSDALWHAAMDDQAERQTAPTGRTAVLRRR